MKNPRRWLIALGCLVVVAALAVPAFFAWRAQVVRNQHGRALQAVQGMVARGEFRPARAALQAYLKQEGAALSSAELAVWAQLDVRVSAQLRDLSRLLFLYQREPALLAGEEQAALLVVRALGALRESEAARVLREKWQGRETQAQAWLALDADLLLQAGRRSEALALLQSRTFGGPEDCGRLVRLALLHGAEPAKARQFLDAAYAADPKNPDVRSFRGQVLENAGQAELARIEYVAALVSDPRDAIRREQLVSFYVRKGNFGSALRTCADGLSDEAPDFLWLQWQFWSRMIRAEPDRGIAAPAGRWQPLVNQLRTQPSEVFWDWQAAESWSEQQRDPAQRQEIFWLQLWQLLREGKEAAAAELLATDRFRAASYHRELASSLRIVLRWRASGQEPTLGDFDRSAGVTVRHVLLEQIETWGKGALGGGRVLPAETGVFLRGKSAFAGLALAAGWTEAALHLVDLKADFSSEPEWFRFGLTQALRFNRTPGDALAFLRRLPEGSATQLLQGEIFLSQKDPVGARSLLEPLAAQTSDAGFRAAWLLATHAAETGDHAGAERLVRGQPRLRDHLLGRELLVRCQLLRGDRAGARRQYEALAAESAEAVTFLAREAYGAEDWVGARKWTEMLLARLPDEMQLRENLVAIEAAAARAAKRPR